MVSDRPVRDQHPLNRFHLKEKLLALDRFSSIYICVWTITTPEVSMKNDTALSMNDTFYLVTIIRFDDALLKIHSNDSVRF